MIKLVWCYEFYTWSTRLQGPFEKSTPQEKFNLHPVTDGPTSETGRKRKCHLTWLAVMKRGISKFKWKFNTKPIMHRKTGNRLVMFCKKINYCFQTSSSFTVNGQANTSSMPWSVMIIALFNFSCNLPKILLWAKKKNSQKRKLLRRHRKFDGSQVPKSISLNLINFHFWKQVTVLNWSKKVVLL